MHLVKLSADLQRCPVLGLWNVEPHKQTAAHAEEEEYEEAEALQMLLLGDIIFSKKREEEEREHIASACYFCLVLCHCLICTHQAHHYDREDHSHHEQTHPVQCAGHSVSS